MTDLILSTVLDPNEKANHFKKYWDEELQSEAIEHAEQIVSLTKNLSVNHWPSIRSVQGILCTHPWQLGTHSYYKERSGIWDKNQKAPAGT